METRRTIVPTRDGYERWAEVYDSDGNPLVALEERHFPLMFPNVNGLLVADVRCGTFDSVEERRARWRGVQPGSRARRGSHVDAAATATRMQIERVCADFGYTSDVGLCRRRGEF